MAHRISRSPTPTSTAPPPAISCASATPRLSSRSRQDFAVYGDECKFGGGKTLRDGMGQAAGVVPQDQALDLRHHQRADRRLHRHLQSRCRHQERPDLRHRQGGKSRCHGRRHAGHDRRRHHRGHRRRRTDPHRRRHRHAHSLHLPAAGVRGNRRGPDHHGRRRHRSRHRHLRDDLHARRAPHPA